MAARLVIEEGDLKGLTLSLEDGDTWTIGRDPDECQLVIEDPLVSRKHLIARRVPEGIAIENLSTTNPVQINDEEIDDQPRLLQNGDTIKVGNEILRYYEDSSAHVIDEGIADNSDELEEESEREELEEEIPERNELEEERGREELEEEPERNELEETSETEPSPHEEPPTAPPPTPSAETPEAETERPHTDTIFEEENPDLATLAEIDFGLVETGRWLLKVIGGPNNGAEFYMQTGNSYILGTDPHSSDIVFHDTSVSRQHARITITPEDTLIIEDLKSRNGVLINGVPIEGQQPLIPNTIVTLGTTSFAVYDREGEMQTIISPLLPSIVKALQQEPPKAEEKGPGEPPAEGEPSPTAKAPIFQQPIIETPPQAKPSSPFGPYIFVIAVIALFVIAGVGTTFLFHEKPIVVSQQTQENANALIKQALAPFPMVHFTFNKATGGILLAGHVETHAEKSELHYRLEGLKFIKSIDDTGIVIDEGVWKEFNSILARNPAWRGIAVSSPAPGQFVLTGYLQTHEQADQLFSYINLNFPYADLLKKEVVIEENIVDHIDTWLKNAQLNDVMAKMTNGEVTLSGTAPADKMQVLSGIVDKIKRIPGVRSVNNLVQAETAETGIIDISDHYTVSGTSHIGNQYTVVINGRILTVHDELDGMTITKITHDRIFLEKDGLKYRIDY